MISVIGSFESVSKFTNFSCMIQSSAVSRSHLSGGCSTCHHIFSLSIEKYDYQ